MEIKEIKREKSEATVEYKVDFNEFKPYLDKVYKKERGRFMVPGFRKGKAPRVLIERHYGEDIFYDEALNAMIPELYDKSIHQLDYEPVAQPQFSVEELDKERGLVLKAVVTLLPEVKLGQYKNLEIEAVDTKVSDEEVMDKLKEEAEKNARMVPVDVAQEEDIVTIDFDGSI
ncbi:MAG TPA: trigger factor family protein, partial [Clostridia bacterium]|nr:trigger factor family protein [Clostridia bacterium]